MKPHPQLVFFSQKEKNSVFGMCVKIFSNFFVMEHFVEMFSLYCFFINKDENALGMRISPPFLELENIKCLVNSCLLD